MQNLIIGMDIHIRDAILKYCKLGAMEQVIDLLLADNCNFCVVHNGTTPLHEAIRYNHACLFRVLLSLGFNYDVLDSDGVSAYDLFLSSSLKNDSTCMSFLQLFDGHIKRKCSYLFFLINFILALIIANPMTKGRFIHTAHRDVHKAIITLAELGFHSIVRTNRSNRDMKCDIDSFSCSLEPMDFAFFYFIGIGSHRGDSLSLLHGIDSPFECSPSETSYLTVSALTRKLTERARILPSPRSTNDNGKNKTTLHDAAHANLKTVFSQDTQGPSVVVLDVHTPHLPVTLDEDRHIKEDKTLCSEEPVTSQVTDACPLFSDASISLKDRNCLLAPAVSDPKNPIYVADLSQNDVFSSTSAPLLSRGLSSAANGQRSKSPVLSSLPQKPTLEARKRFANREFYTKMILSNCAPSSLQNKNNVNHTFSLNEAENWEQLDPSLMLTNLSFFKQTVPQQNEIAGDNTGVNFLHNSLIYGENSSLSSSLNFDNTQEGNEKHQYSFRNATLRDNGNNCKSRPATSTTNDVTLLPPILNTTIDHFPSRIATLKMSVDDGVNLFNNSIITPQINTGNNSSFHLNSNVTTAHPHDNQTTSTIFPPNTLLRQQHQFTKFKSSNAIQNRLLDGSQYQSANEKSNRYQMRSSTSIQLKGDVDAESGRIFFSRDSERLRKNFSRMHGNSNYQKPTLYVPKFIPEHETHKPFPAIAIAGSYKYANLGEALLDSTERAVNAGNFSCSQVDLDENLRSGLVKSSGMIDLIMKNEMERVDETAVFASLLQDHTHLLMDCDRNIQDKYKSSSIGMKKPEELSNKGYFARNVSTAPSDSHSSSHPPSSQSDRRNRYSNNNAVENSIVANHASPYTPLAGSPLQPLLLDFPSPPVSKVDPSYLSKVLSLNVQDSLIISPSLMHAVSAVSATRANLKGPRVPAAATMNSSFLNRADIAKNGNLNPISLLHKNDVAEGKLDMLCDYELSPSMEHLTVNSKSSVKSFALSPEIKNKVHLQSTMEGNKKKDLLSRGLRDSPYSRQPSRRMNRKLSNSSGLGENTELLTLQLSPSSHLASDGQSNLNRNLNFVKPNKTDMIVSTVEDLREKSIISGLPRKISMVGGTKLSDGFRAGILPVETPAGHEIAVVLNSALNAPLVAHMVNNKTEKDDFTSTSSNQSDGLQQLIDPLSFYGWLFWSILNNYRPGEGFENRDNGILQLMNTSLSRNDGNIKREVNSNQSYTVQNSLIEDVLKAASLQMTNFKKINPNQNNSKSFEDVGSITEKNKDCEEGLGFQTVRMLVPPSTRGGSVFASVLMKALLNGNELKACLHHGVRETHILTEGSEKPRIQISPDFKPSHLKAKVAI